MSGRLNLSDARGLFRARSILSRGPPGLLRRLRSVVGMLHLSPRSGPRALHRFLVVLRRHPSRLFATAGNLSISGDQSTVKAGTEIQAETERLEVTLSLAEMDQATWFQANQHPASGTELGSLNALRQANDTSWVQGRGYPRSVKLVAGPPVMQIIRPTDLLVFDGQPIRNGGLDARLVLRDINGEPPDRTAPARSSRWGDTASAARRAAARREYTGSVSSKL